MAVIDSLKGFYFALEDRYYNLLDWLDGKGIPVYSVVDAIESRNIPSFPVAIICCIVIILLLWLALSAIFFAPGSTVTVIVGDASGNALQGATVSYSFEEKTGFGSTESNGKFSFSAKRGAKVKVIARKDGFKQKDGELTPAEDTAELQLNLESETTAISKTIELRDAASNSLVSKEVTVSFRCSQALSYFAEKTTSTGRITLSDIPSDCGELIATPSGNFSTENGVIDLSLSAPQLLLAEETAGKGKANVFVKNAQGKAVSGITVKLLHSNGTEEASEYSSSTGSASFEDVPAGNYYVRTYDGQNNKYAEFDSSLKDDIKQLSADKTIEFQVVLEEKTIGKISFLVSDAATGQPVQNADVSLQRNNLTLQTKKTDADGRAEFPVTEGLSNYAARIDHPSYLVVFRENLGARTTDYEISLVLATVSNTQSLVVTVTDQLGAPVENARVALKNLEGTSMSNDQVTGIDGNVEFARIPAGRYFATAFKDGFEPANSNPFEVEERKQNSATITMSIGSGAIELTVLDEETAPVVGATVKVYNAFNNKEMQQETTGSDGKARANIRADKKVYFVVSAQDFLKYTTVSISPEAGNTLPIEVRLVKDVSSLEVELLGLFSGGSEASESLTEGEKYTARLQLRVPAGQQFSEAGVHFRTGAGDEGKTNLMDADELFISKTRSAATATIKGIAYSPTLGYASDSKKLTTGNAKWANFIFSNPSAGVYEIEADVQVRGSAKTGAVLELSYRAWGKRGSTFTRYPVDKVLGEAESTSSKQALYANSNKALFTVGPASLCSEYFCYKFEIEDIFYDLKSAVSDSYTADISNDYKLYFTIVSKGATTYPDAELEIKSEPAGLGFQNYSIRDAEGRTFTADTNGAVVSRKVGSLQKGSTISGELKFRTLSDGLSRLILSIKSEKKSVFQQGIDITINAANEMRLDVLPRVIMPFIDNDVLTRVSDKNGLGISNASISVFYKGTRIASGETDSNGVYNFKINAPDAGAIVRIEARKTGYKTIIKEMKVGENIITVIPPSISKELSTTGIFTVGAELLVTNETSILLHLSSLSISNDFNGLVEFSWNENYLGMELESDVDENLSMLISLTDAGKLLTERKNLSGNLAVQVESRALQKSWVVNIPIKIRIGLGGEVSDPACLQLNPNAWTFSTEKKQVTFKGKIKNNCRVSNSGVLLRNLGATLELDTGEELGTISLTSTIPNSLRVIVSTGGVIPTHAPLLEAGKEYSIEMVFTPDRNIASGEMKGNIVFKALNATQNGSEEISSKISLDGIVSRLSECIEVRAPDRIQLENSAFNLGYGNYQNYGYGSSTATYDPYNRFALPYQPGYSYGTAANQYIGPQNVGYLPTGTTSAGAYAGTAGYSGYPYTSGDYGINYPNSYYYDPYYGNLNYDANASMLWTGTSFADFTVANNCAAAVTVKLDAAAQIVVRKTSADLAPGDEKVFRVEAGPYIGTYPLDVKGKIKDSKESLTRLKRILVEILAADDPSRYNDCITLSRRSFRVLELLQGTATASVTNSCYAQGIRLNYNSLSIEQGTAGGLIQGVNVIDLSTSSSGNSQAQVLTFLLVGSGSYGGYGAYGSYPYGTTAYPYGATAYPYGTGTAAGYPYGTGLYQTGLPIQTGLPVTTMYPGMATNATATLIVRYSTPRSGEQSKPFQLTITETAQEAVNRRIAEQILGPQSPLNPMNAYGDPAAIAQRCIVDGSLNYGERCYDDSDFKDNILVLPAKQVLRTVTNAGTGSVTAPFTNVAWQQQAVEQQKAAEARQKELEKAQTTTGTVVLPMAGLSILDKVKSNPQLLSSLGGGGLSKLFGGYSGMSNYPFGYPSAQNVCGTSDRLELVDKEVEQDGVKFKFEVVGSGQTSGSMMGFMASGTSSIKLTVDRSGATKSDKIYLNRKIRAKLYRTVPYSVSDVEIPVYICVVGKAKAGEGGEAQKASEGCPAGTKSGEAALSELGMGRLLFSWQFNGDKVGEKACDNPLALTGLPSAGGNYYCDATQFGISLAKKYNSLDGYLKDKVGFMVNDKTKGVVEAAIGKEEMEKSQNTEHLFRWAKRQTIITDETLSETKVVFFLDKDGAILNYFPNRQLPDMGSSYAGKTVDNLKKMELNTQMDYLQKLTTSAATVERARSIVLEIDVSDIKETSTDNKVKALKKMGAEEVVATFDREGKKEEKRHIVLTLREYYNLASKCWSSIKGKEKTAITCAVKKLGSTTESITIDTALLSWMLEKGVFKEGIRDRPELSLENISKEADAAKRKEMIDETWRIVRDSAEIEGIEPMEETFRKVFFQANLLADGYTDGFRKDFANFYTTDLKAKVADDAKGGVEKIGATAFEVVEGTDKKNVVAEPGIYDIIVAYQFASDGTPKVKLFKNSGIEKILQNNFFANSFPIDGAVGTSGASPNRSGYGVTMGEGAGKVKIAREGEGDKIVEVTGATGSGAKSFAAVKAEPKAEETINKSQILDIDASGNGKLEFLPTMLFRLSLSLTGADKKAALYKVVAADAPAEELQIDWQKAKAIKESPQGLCGKGGTTTAFGVEATGSETPTASVFAPFDKKLTMSLVCAEDSATLKVEQLSPLETTATSLGSFSATAEKGSESVFMPKQPQNKVFTILNYVDAVKKGTVCIGSTKDALKLYWRTAAGTTAAATSKAPSPPTG